MTPTYFGQKDRQLLGLFHEARGRLGSDLAVLLCYPAPQEYMRAHYAFRRLASLLSKEGIASLRFDYFGTGDSAGELTSATALDWQQDIVTAAQELKDTAGVKRVSLVGFRLGATLAAAAVAQGLKVRDLVLWEPVTSGLQHLKELRALDAARLAQSRTPPRAMPGVDEVLGFELTPLLRTSIERLDLRGFAPLSNAERTIVAVSEELPETAELRAALSTGASVPDYLFVPDEGATGQAAVESSMLSNKILQEMVASLSRRAA